MFRYISLLALVSTALSASSPPSGAITVGTGGTYATLAEALEDTSSDTYFIYSGSYTGQTEVTRANIKIYGQTSDADSYLSNTVTLTDDVTASEAGSNDASGTLQIHAAGVSLYNLNIENTYGDSASHSQAIALSVQQGEFGAYGVSISGYQDTLLANVGTQIYSNSRISGAVDFIFGQSASIWVTDTTIETLGTGWVTASGRDEDDDNYYVLNRVTIEGTGTQYLGRPWREYARVIVQSSDLGDVIQSEGWSEWSDSTPNTDHVTYAEYDNTGAGASGTRASFASTLSSAVDIATVLGSDYADWVDSDYPSA